MLRAILLVTSKDSRSGVDVGMQFGVGGDGWDASLAI